MKATRILLAALALGLLAGAPPASAERGDWGNDRAPTGNDRDSDREGQEARTIRDFLNSVRRSEDGPYGGGDAHGPHADHDAARNASGAVGGTDGGIGIGGTH